MTLILYDVHNVHTMYIVRCTLYRMTLYDDIQCTMTLYDLVVQTVTSLSHQCRKVKHEEKEKSSGTKDISLHQTLSM